MVAGSGPAAVQVESTIAWAWATPDCRPRPANRQARVLHRVNRWRIHITRGITDGSLLSYVQPMVRQLQFGQRHTSRVGPIQEAGMSWRDESTKNTKK